MSYTKIKDKPSTWRFNSPEAMLFAQDSETNKKENAHRSYEKAVTTGCLGWFYEQDWFGFDKKVTGDLREAVKRELDNGWGEGCKLINDARSRVLNASLAAPASRRLRMSHGHVTGLNPNVSALLRGEPTAYSQWERKPKTQAVRLICELTADSGKDANSLVWRGAATLVIADLLQEAGYSVEIWASSTVINDRTRKPCVNVCMVKGADQQPIPDMLASVLVSPRFYRTGVIYSMRVMNEPVPYGGGQCASLDPKVLKGTDLEDLSDGIYIEGCFSAAEAVSHINQVVKGLNNGP